MNIYKIGSTGEMVRRIQKALHLMPDGVFGKQTEEAVKEFQRTNHLTIDGIVGVKTLALLGLGMLLPKSRRVITEIIVHCTATPAGKDFTVADITRWHRQRGFTTIGYHYVVYRDGSIHEGRNIDIAGAHCTGHNSHSIGVCYVGGLTRDGKRAADTRTNAQKTALRKLLINLRALYPSARIHGHRDFANKACPSFNATAEYSNIR